LVEVLVLGLAPRQALISDKGALMPRLDDQAAPSGKTSCGS